MKPRLACYVFLVLSLTPPRSHAQSLIHEDIGPYEWIGTHSEIPGLTALVYAGRRATAGDRKLETSYVDLSRNIVVDVTVSTHEDPAWVLHELERQYRRALFPGSFSEGLEIRASDGQRRFELQVTTRISTGGFVAWNSGETTTIQIEFTKRGEDRTPFLPTEVVDAYLALYPSSLLDSIQDTPEHHTDFIRKEFERILAYAARDLAVGQAGAEQAELSALDVEKWLTNFATYREFYFKVGSGEELRWTPFFGQPYKL